MTPGRPDAARVRLPVYASRVHERDADATVTRRVFCIYRGGSTELEECRTCRRLVDIDADGVACSGAVHVDDELLEDPLGAAAGEVLRRDAVAIRAGTPLPSGAASALVVDDSGRLLHALAAPTGPGDLTSRTSVPFAVESATLRAALGAMVRAHLRTIPIVTSEGTLVGTLVDLDALAALARARRVILRRIG